MGYAYGPRSFVWHPPPFIPIAAVVQDESRLAIRCIPVRSVKLGFAGIQADQTIHGVVYLAVAGLLV